MNANFLNVVKSLRALLHSSCVCVFIVLTCCSVHAQLALWTTPTRIGTRRQNTCANLHRDESTVGVQMFPSSFHLYTGIQGFESSNDFRNANLPFQRCEDSVGSKDPAVIRPSDARRRREQAKTLQLVGANRRQDEHESNLMIWYSASCNTTPAHPLTHALEIETINGQSCRIFEIGSIDCG